VEAMAEGRLAEVLVQLLVLDTCKKYKQFVINKRREASRIY
jgi:hypothetical protein